MDKERILAKIDEMDGYLEELESIRPSTFEEYESSIEKKRACERLLQLAIECVIDVCAMIVKECKLGLPADEDDMFRKIRKAGVINNELEEKLRKMKGFRNILIHRYGEIDDELVFEKLFMIEDFEKFKEAVLEFLRKGEIE